MQSNPPTTTHDGIAHIRVGDPLQLGDQPIRHCSPTGARIRNLRAAPVGERNHRLNRAAFSLGMLAAGGELDAAQVEDELLDAALDLGLPERRSQGQYPQRPGGRGPRTTPPPRQLT